MDALLGRIYSDGKRKTLDDEEPFLNLGLKVTPEVDAAKTEQRRSIWEQRFPAVPYQPKKQWDAIRIEEWHVCDTLMWIEEKFPPELKASETFLEIFGRFGKNLLQEGLVEGWLKLCEADLKEELPEVIKVAETTMKTMDWIEQMLKELRSIANRQPKVRRL